MIKLKSLLKEEFQPSRPALRLPDGEIIIALSNERTHAQIYMRLLKNNHPNVISKSDPDVESGWVDKNNKFLTRDELSMLLGYNADTFGNPKYV